MLLEIRALNFDHGPWTSLRQSLKGSPFREIEGAKI